MIKLLITDSRRLTGANLFWNKAGAILDVDIHGIDKDKIINIWQKQCRKLLNALSWQSQQITHRVYAGGASLVISAPIDCLYAATEITESAWSLTVAAVNDEVLDLDKILKRLHQEILGEQNHALIALQNAAALHKVKFLSDDDDISLGYGKTCQIYWVKDLPKVTDIDWNSIKDIPVAMITGTNGKTSCSQFIAQALDSVGRHCGIIGTLGNGFYGALEEGLFTTPDVISLQKQLAKFRDQHADAVAMEVSSHGLRQQRTAGVDFSIGVFTNLTRDHLDYHGDMQAYAAAKKRLFTDYPIQHAIINADDEFGQQLLVELPGNCSTISYGITA
ncbi:MAG: hypothetical protein L3J53_09055, partial [Proteobacteria bacterium]|nr:hypothetical protein [Pseudomonadota bacterium]